MDNSSNTKEPVFLQGVRVMKKHKLTQARRECFLRALAVSGSVTAAAAMAGTSRTRVYELRKVDPAFAALWDEAEETATDALEAEARRRAIDGVELPVISMGKILKDADGNVVTIRRYSDQLLTLLLKGHR